MQILLSRTQAGPGRKVKQEQEDISRNHIQAFIPGSVDIRCCDLKGGKSKRVTKTGLKTPLKGMATSLTVMSAYLAGLTRIKRENRDINSAILLSKPMTAISSHCG